MQRDDATLLDIARFCQQILVLTAGMNKGTFEQDIRTQLAVLYEIAVLGEAVKRLSTAFQDQHSAIPWKDIAGMRDKVIHQYDRVKLDLVWEVVQREIPTLLENLSPLLPSEELGN